MTKCKSIIATSVLATLMCLTLVLGVCLSGATLVAHAEESVKTIEVSSIDDYYVATQTNHNCAVSIKITNDLDFSSKGASFFDVYDNTTLDLNGHTVTLSSNSIRLRFFDSANFTLTDSSSAKSGKIYQNAMNYDSIQISAYEDRSVTAKIFLDGIKMEKSYNSAAGAMIEPDISSTIAIRNCKFIGGYLFSDYGQIASSNISIENSIFELVQNSSGGSNAFISSNEDMTVADFIPADSELFYYVCTDLSNGIYERQKAERTTKIKDISIKSYGFPEVKYDHTIEIVSKTGMTKYSVVVNQGKALDIWENAVDTAVEGKKITITANPATKGQIFDKWITTGYTLADPTNAEITITMPANAVSFTATYKDKPHTHSVKLVQYVAKTCTTNGLEQHYKCTECDALFLDAEATQSVVEADLIILAGHEYRAIAEVPATCSATGMEEHFECSVCHKLFDSSRTEKTAEELTIAKNDTAHSYGSMIDEVPATCASEGTKAHKDCLLCGKHFDNANNEITDLSLAKNDSHDLETVWTKVADGHYHKCKREGCKDNGKVDFAVHTPDRSEATEENAVKCTVCDYIITPALGHTHHLTLVPGKAATCQADGKKAYYTCDGCSEKFEDEAGTIAITADIETWGIIPKAHKFGEWIAEVPATKEATGTKAHKDCEFCGKHFDNDGNEITDLTIAKLPLGGDQPGGGDNPGGNDNPGGEVIEPKQEGLSGGAIAGIVIGSVAVVGIGGFAFLWFAIKKKSFAELIAAIKGIFKKK